MTYTEQDKINILSNHIKHYNKPNRYKASVSFSTVIGSDRCSIYIDLRYSKNDKIVQFQSIVPLYLNTSKSKYLPGDEILDINKNITDFIPEKEINNVLKTVEETFGPDFEEIFKRNRNLKISNKITKKYNL